MHTLLLTTNQFTLENFVALIGIFLICFALSSAFPKPYSRWVFIGLVIAFLLGSVFGQETSVMPALPVGINEIQSGTVIGPMYDVTAKDGTEYSGAVFRSGNTIITIPGAGQGPSIIQISEPGFTLIK